MRKITLLLNSILIVWLIWTISAKAIGQENHDNSNLKSLKYYTFPNGALVCVPNDYIIQKVGQHWQVFLVEELVLISPLCTFSFNPDNTKFVEQITIADSALPPRYGTIQLLVTSFGNKFKNASLAIQAIDQGKLDLRTKHICRGVQDFPRKHCQIYKPKS